MGFGHRAPRLMKRKPAFDRGRSEVAREEGSHAHNEPFGCGVAGSTEKVAAEMGLGSLA